MTMNWNTPFGSASLDYFERMINNTVSNVYVYCFKRGAKYPTQYSFEQFALDALLAMAED